MKKTKKILSLVLAVLMLVSVVPMSVSASDRWDVINAKGVSGDDIVAQARTYLGVPYDISGGNYKYRTGFGETMMFDCSGFVYRVCRDVGLASSHKNANMGMFDPNGKPLEGQDDNGNYYITADTRYQRYYGSDISSSVKKYIDTGDYSELKAGDLLFVTSDNSSISHVVIYEGNGTIIHSEGYQGCVAEHSIDRYHSSKNKSNWYFAACRLVEDIIETGDRVEFNGHYYQVFDEGLDWFGAKAKCEELGGHLVTITSQEEQDFVNDYVKNGNRINYWLGATDEKVEGEWEWVSGENFEYENWHSGEPSNSEYIENEFENYLILWADLNCVWNDAYYDVGERLPNVGHTKIEDIGFICEWENINDTPTEPTPCKHPNATTVPQLNPNCIDIGFTAGTYCNDCATWLSGHEVIAVGDHKDNTGDGICDTCLKQLSTNSQTEQSKKNVVQRVVDAVKNVVNKVVSFFKKLFGR